MNEVKMKLCPFCGGDVRLLWNGYYGAPVIRHLTPSCGCIMERRVFFGMTEDEAAGLWNRRPEPVTLYKFENLGDDLVKGTKAVPVKAYIAEEDKDD